MPLKPKGKKIMKKKKKQYGSKKGDEVHEETIWSQKR